MSRKLNSLELKIHKAALADAQKTLSQKEVDAIAPDPKKRTDALNFLLQVGLLVPGKDAKGENHYRAPSKQELELKKGLTKEEQVVLNHIQTSGNEGIWTKHLKGRTEMHQTVLDRCLKSLLQKNIIKVVKGSIKYPTRKLYMLQGLEPSVEITGGPWYTDNELDTEFIKLLSKACLHHIKDKSDPKGKRSEAGIQPLYPISTAPSYPTALDIKKFLGKSKITETKLEVEHVEMLLYVLQLDGEIEKVPTFGSTTWESAIKDDGGADQSGSDDDDNDDDDDAKSSSRKRKRKGDSSGSRSKSKKSRRSYSSDSESDDDDDTSSKSKKKKSKKSRDESESESDDRRKKNSKKKKKRKDDDSSQEDEDNSDDDKASIIKKKKRQQDSDSGSDSDEEEERQKRKNKKSSSSRQPSDGDDDDDDDESEDEVRKKKKKRRKNRNDSDSSDDSESDDEDARRRRKKSKAKKKRSPSPTYEFDDEGGEDMPAAFVYRAVRQEQVPLGISQAPCGGCPVFDFCKEGGPVNPTGCHYYDHWLVQTPLSLE